MMLEASSRIKQNYRLLLPTTAHQRAKYKLTAEVPEKVDKILYQFK